MANFQYLTKDNVIEVYKTSKQYTEGLTDQFFEYERIARNKPHGSIPKEYPKTTDGTTASIIRKTPHRIIQQLPTGRVVSDTPDWLSVIASFIYTHKIIPQANEGYALLQKCWLVVEKFLTFGFCPTYAPFVEHGGYFCTDLRLPYWGDIFVQPGKLSDVDSNYMFMRSWWQTKDIEALIDTQSKIKQADRTWDVGVLEQIKTMEQTKDEKSKTPAEREKNINTKGGIELITGLQRGIGAKFYTFHVSSGLVARTKVNKDPRGELPVSFAYGDIDGSNPFGRGIVDLVGSLQNLMDGEMQMYQYNRALQLNPPLIKRGNFSKNKIKFAPNIIIDVGSEPNATVEPLTIDTTALVNFPQNYGLMKSQMLNLLASPDTSISSDVGNPGFSKTPQGVLASQSNLSVDDNYVRKQFETWFERWSETAINLYFAEREGVEVLQLNDETIEELQNLDGFDPNQISPDGKIKINYSSATPMLKFRVNAASSKESNDPAQVGIATNLLETVMKFPMLNKNFGGRIDVDELAEKIVMASGIADPGLIAPEPTKAEKQAKLQAKQQPNAFSPMYDKPAIRIDYRDVEDAGSRAELLKLAGAPPTAQLPPLAPGIAEQAARGTNTLSPDEGGAGGTPVNPIDLGDIYKQTADPSVKAEIETMAGLHPDGNTLTPENLLQAQGQAHSQDMDKAKHALDVAKATHEAQIAREQLKISKRPVAKNAK